MKLLYRLREEFQTHDETALYDDETQTKSQDQHHVCVMDLIEMLQARKASSPEVNH